LTRAGVESSVSLDQTGNGNGAGQKSVGDLLAEKNRSGERYHLAGEIARGGMGAVMRAVDCDIRREVAVKYLLDQADATKKLRFVEEAQITGQLEHPNIVPIHELGVDSTGKLFFSMKMVKGRSLGQVLDQLRLRPNAADKDWSLGRLLTLFVSICHALHYAHARGVIHRDLKPANIMIGDFGEVYVMDWGLAKILKANGAPARDVGPHAAVPVRRPAANAGSGKVVTNREGEADLTQDGAIMGTPVYMSPEQAAGQVQALDQRSDVYALGAILYELLTLEPPVDREGDYLAILVRVAQGQIVPPEARSPKRARVGLIPRELSAVALKALATRPEDRYPDVETLRRDVERFLEGRSVSAKQDSAWEVLVKFMRRNKAFSATTLVALLVLALVIGFSLKINYEARLSAEEARGRAEEALADFRREQDRRQEQARESVPAFVRAARLAANERNFPDALAQLRIALQFAPDSSEAQLLLGKVLLLQQDFGPAAEVLGRYLERHPEDTAAGKLVELCRQADPADGRTLAPLLQALLPAGEFTLDGGLQLLRNKIQGHYRERIDKAWPGLARRLTTNPKGQLELNLDFCELQVTDLSPLRGMPLHKLILTHCRQVKDLRPLAGMPLESLILRECHEVRGLGPLRGMPLTQLDLWECRQVRDLTPLANLPLTYLDIGGCNQIQDLTPLKNNTRLKVLFLTGCPVRDLAPLRSLPLVRLNLYGTQVRNLGPLRDLPLRSLDMAELPVEDLTPLANLELEILIFSPRHARKGLDGIRHMKSLKWLSTHGSDKQFPPAEFWKKYDARELHR
jgi:serine/threonine protein kinase